MSSSLCLKKGDKRVAMVMVMVIATVLPYVAVAVGGCKKMLYATNLMGKALMNHEFRSTEANSDSHCSSLCFHDDRCISYNFGPIIEFKGICNLSHADHLQYPEDFVDAAGHYYSAVENSCDCTKDQICRLNFLDGTHHCDFNDTSFHRCHAFNTSSDGVIQLEATHSSWQADGFCRVDFTPTSIVTGQQYSITVDLRARHVSHDTNRGVHPGVAFNMVDGDNFDVVYFRPHSVSTCFQPGSVRAGAFSGKQSSSCGSQHPGRDEWFSVSLSVTQSSVTVKINSVVVGTFSPTFPLKRQGAVVVANGYDTVLYVRNYKA
ncbi:uncharacterized skeletal organic matrix protein 7-like isoform X1 [Nematostella vectensis]|uniref:uncharacterized skeletal organic matrix protein 7-like isoform X1 n=1 Tax=Nematostella vectensis TaxID=45351 RepID=UPI0020772B88|nr:uncharacterized skeletal organic matrix protein 7-like isoform X1 [Nematostella vectensis]